MTDKIDESTVQQLLEMYYEDGMKEREIAKSLGLRLIEVHEVLATFEWTGDDGEWTDEEE